MHSGETFPSFTKLKKNVLCVVLCTYVCVIKCFVSFHLITISILLSFLFYSITSCELISEGPKVHFSHALRTEYGLRSVGGYVRCV